MPQSLDDLRNSEREASTDPLLEKPPKKPPRKPKSKVDEEAEYVDPEEERKKKLGFVAYTWLRCQELGIVKTVVWIFLTMMYQVLGAWIYIATEGEHDAVIRIEQYHNATALLRHREIWIEDFVEGVNTIRGRPDSDENKIEMYRKLIEGYESSMNYEVPNPVMADEGWSWYNAIFFVCSVYSSIGFGGRLYPKTTLGRCVTMVFGFFAIPFFLTMTGDLGLTVFEGFYVLWFWSISWWRSREEPEFDEDQLRGFRTSEYNELYKKQLATFPILGGVILSVASLALCSGLVQFFEPEWSYFDANYYFVTSFLFIGLGDISPSAPKNGPGWTLIVHIVMLTFSITFIGLFSHVMSRRVELAYVNIGYAIHMEFRTRQVEPDISVMKSNKSPIQEAAQINLIVRKLGSAESFFYSAMDTSRRKLLSEAWHRKANMECVEIQTNLPKREVGCQHLMNVDENDLYNYGDDLGEEPPPPKKLDAPDLRMYVYKIVT